MWHTMSISDVEKKLSTNISSGLKSKEIQKRKKEFGQNKLDEGKKRSLILRFLDEFKDFMIIILLIAASISALVSYIEKTNEYMDSIIIVAIVIFNAIMGLIQEEKAEKSLEALKKLSTPTTKVKRDGKIISIESVNIVPGDIIILEAGNFVPADARLIQAYNLKVEESALTGETISITKDANVILNSQIPLGDTLNMVFSTTIITSRTWRSNSNKYRYEYKSRKNC